ncbi:MAG: LytTR family DNA-binding domain-containing protein, partial [Bacteroidales bacterium]|nr:LytTR family DNA-binding domain-containing protein [Bacteroidales bacterium]
KSNTDPDLIMIDIKIADGNSFLIFSQIKVVSPVIFTTAYNEFALQAFKENSIDYLLKPLKLHDLEKAIEKLKRLSAPKPTAEYMQLLELLGGKQPKLLRRFMVKAGQQIKVFTTEEVAYFYIVEKIVFAMLKSGDRYPLDYTLDQLEQSLDPKSFFRINRAFIISFEAIDKLHTYSKSRIKVILKPACEEESISSTERSPLFRAWLSDDNNS